jgi:CheY-like chemotaxis protein
VVIRRCAEHITSIVEALLDISQVENGVIRVKPEPVRFDQFIDQMLRMVRPSAASKGLEFHLETQGRLPPMVRMDQSRLRQVLLNLLLNAIKYTDHGAVTLTVRYAAQMATFEVSDTGPGIREEDQEAIFLPFERGGDDALKARPGVGLGLSIARAIVDMLGGKLELVSSSAEGTMFRVTMMLGEVTASHAQARPRREVSGYLGRRRSILICDDDAEQRKFLSELLGSLGFAVETAPNGEAAVAMVTGAAGKAYDLAILDISLPGMSGWDVAGQLREALGQDFRILMLSANAQEFHRPETKAPVHDHFLVKPVEFNGLIETVGGLLDLAWGLESDGAKPIAPPVLTPTTLEPEAAAHAMRIRELLRIGYLRGIEKEIRLLAEQPAMGDLASKLYACLDRFDLPGMARILEEC